MATATMKVINAQMIRVMDGGGSGGPDNALTAPLVNAEPSGSLLCSRLGSSRLSRLEATDGSPMNTRRTAFLL